MRAYPILTACIGFCLLPLCAYTQLRDTSAREVDFTIDTRNGVMSFTPVPPPLEQMAGAPPAFFDYYWEFGDGTFSFREKPQHQYEKPGEYDVQLWATGKYDNGKPPKTRTKTVNPPPKTAVAALDDLPAVIQEMDHNLGLRAIRNPRPGEEFVGIIAYRNTGEIPSKGKLWIFFNQKAYKNPHFDFAEARTHFGERESTNEDIGRVDPALSSAGALVSLNGIAATLPGALEPELLALMGEYRTYRNWSFENLQPGELRHLFLSFNATPQMLADTNAVITISTLLQTDDGYLERRELELEIVASHDPNHISVNPNRTGFRGVRRKDLTYKVQFQNTGEGPASKVELTCVAPKGVDAASLKVLDYYPQCPMCDAAPPGASCLDTTFAEGKIIFTFRNIYLPGTRQDGVNDRDSTKGFVQYRILPSRRIEKRPLENQASIVFDKNEPIVTNRSTTRFKPGISPALIAGMAPEGLEPPEGPATMFGVSLAPFKPYRRYLQFEAYAGFGQSQQQTRNFRDSLSYRTVRQINGVVREAVVDSLSIGTETTTVEAFTINLVPLQLRHNVTDFLSFGAGAQVTLRQVEESRDINQSILRRAFFCRDPSLPRDRCEPIPELTLASKALTQQSDTKTLFDLSLFADVNLGMVRRGPAIGFRPVYRLGKEADFYAWVYLTFKL